MKEFRILLELKTEYFRNAIKNAFLTESCKVFFNTFAFFSLPTLGIFSAAETQSSRTRRLQHTCNVQIKMEVSAKSVQGENHKKKKHKKRKQKEVDLEGDTELLNGAVVE